MLKLPLFLMLCMMCTLEGTFANNYFYYPSSAGAVNYQYPFSPYVYSAYAVPVDCDKSTSEGGGEGASTEGGSSEGSTEVGESKEEGESTEGSSESSGEEKKEGEGSSEEGGEKKEEGPGEEKKEEESGEEKKEDSKKRVAKYIFPPVSYPYPPQAQQIVYSAPSYPYMPYKAYSVVQQPASYSLKSSGYSGYSGYPYYSLSNIPVSAGAYSSPVSKTITFAPASGVGVPAGYWNGNVGYYRM